MIEPSFTSTAPYKEKRPGKINDTDTSGVKPKTLKYQKQGNNGQSDLESDVQMGPSESCDGDVEFADPTRPENKLVSNMVSESAHAKGLGHEGFTTLPLDRRR